MLLNPMYATLYHKYAQIGVDTYMTHTAFPLSLVRLDMFVLTI
jgi:hypothetical protein